MDKQFSTFIPAAVLINFLCFFEVLQKPTYLTVVILQSETIYGQFVSYEVEGRDGGHSLYVTFLLVILVLQKQRNLSNIYCTAETEKDGLHYTVTIL